MLTLVNPAQVTYEPYGKTVLLSSSAAGQILAYSLTVEAGDGGTSNVTAKSRTGWAVPSDVTPVRIATKAPLVPQCQ